jgi:hypothetical protein
MKGKEVVWLCGCVVVAFLAFPKSSSGYAPPTPTPL